MCALEHHRDAQPRTPLAVEVAELASRQWGVVSRAQLVAVGAGRGSIGRRLQSGRLHRLHRGVYALGHPVLRWEGHAFAAVLACGPSAPDRPGLEVDLYWPARRLIVETDGFETHGTHSAFEADRARDAALQAAGYRVLRFTWHTDDETILRRLRRLLAR